LVKATRRVRTRFNDGFQGLYDGVSSWRAGRPVWQLGLLGVITGIPRAAAGLLLQWDLPVMINVVRRDGSILDAIARLHGLW